jgi:hypothetical protein
MLQLWWLWHQLELWFEMNLLTILVIELDSKGVIFFQTLDSFLSYKFFYRKTVNKNY